MSEINFSFQTGMPLEYMAVFEAAGRVWSSYLTDDVTINIHVDISDSLPENVIGGALPAFVEKDFGSFNKYFERDISSWNDQTAFDTGLYDGQKFQATVDGFRLGHLRELTMTTANAKTLGKLGEEERENTQALDGYILISDLSNLNVHQDRTTRNNVTWSTAIASGPGSQSLDLFSVALHEIGHVLGFVSGTDRSIWTETLEGLLSQNLDIDDRDRPDSANPGKNREHWDLGDADLTAPLDLYRFSPESAQWEYADLSIGGTKYFSIDGGQSALVEFSTGQETHLSGDGYQGSHWKFDGADNGIMSPVLALGDRNQVSLLDLQALDVIGWDLASSVLGSDGIASDWEIQKTFNLSDSATLFALENLVLTDMANQLGISITQLLSDPATFSNQLSQDRYADVNTMLEESEVYNRKRKRVKSNGRWQEILDMFNQEAHFSTFWMDETEQEIGEVDSVVPSLSPLEEAIASVVSLDDIESEAPVSQDGLPAVAGDDPQIAPEIVLEDIDQGEAISDAYPEDIVPEDIAPKDTTPIDLVEPLATTKVLYAPQTAPQALQLKGSERGDRLLGDRGNDQLIGLKGGDRLLGNAGADELRGNGGADVLRGGNGDDVLMGGQYRDVLHGGQGSDVFVVQDKKAYDIVRDFTIGEDKLRLTGSLTFDQLTLEQQGSHTLIRRDDALLMVLRQVQAEAITVSDVVN